MSVTSITAAQRVALRDAAVKAVRATQPYAENAATPNAAQAASQTFALTALATALGVAGIGGPVALVETRLVGFIGDSRAFLSFTNPGTNRNMYLRDVGIITWVQGYSHGKIVIPVGPITNFIGGLVSGVAGDTTTAILARVPAHILAMKAYGSVRTILIGGTNDRTSSMTLDQTKANILAIIKLYNDAGITVELISETPRGNGSSSYELSTQALKDDHYNCHMWMESLAGTNPQLFIHNVWDRWINTASGTNYYLLDSKSADKIHPNKTGAQDFGIVMSEPMVRRMGQTSILLKDNSAFNASTNPRGPLTSNPMMTGTAGTFENFTPVTGSVLATGWKANLANGAGITVALSQEIINGETWTKAKFAGTGTDTSNPILLIKQAVPFTNIAVGDRIKFVGQRANRGTGLTNVGGRLLLTPQYQVVYDAEDSTPTELWPVGYTGILSMESPTYNYVAVNDQTGIELQLEIVLLKQTAVDCEVWFRGAGAVKSTY